MSGSCSHTKTSQIQIFLIKWGREYEPMCVSTILQYVTSPRPKLNLTPRQASRYVTIVFPFYFIDLKIFLKNKQKNHRCVFKTQS